MGRKLRVDFSNEQPTQDEGNANAHNDQSQNGYSAPTQQPIILPRLPPGKDLPPGASAADEISRILRTLPATQLLDILAQMKALAVNDPPRATELLNQAPQLAYAIFQALLLMDLVSPDAINSVLENPGGGAPPVQPPPSAATAGIAAAYPYPGVTNTPPVAAPAAYGAPPLAPVPAAAAPESAGRDDLLKQVLELPQALVDQLPENERAQIIALRSQFGR